MVEKKNISAKIVDFLQDLWKRKITNPRLYRKIRKCPKCGERKDVWAMLCPPFQTPRALGECHKCNTHWSYRSYQSVKDLREVIEGPEIHLPKIKAGE